MSSIDRLARAIDRRPTKGDMRRSWVATVDSVDGVNHTVTIDGKVYRYVETPTAITASDKVLVERLSVGTAIVTARFP